MSDSSFVPLRIGEDGHRLEPTGLDPYLLPAVTGAIETMHAETRRKYALALDRPPTWRPGPRSKGFRSLQGRPLPTSRDVDDSEADNR
jgi:hypothetical protein